MSRSAPDHTAADRQRRRRELLKEQEARVIRVVLTKEQCDKLERLLVEGFAPDRSAILAKALDALA
jgi:hypothetical protein